MMSEFTAAVKEAARSVQNDMHTVLIGKIKKLAADGCTADIKPYGKYPINDKWLEYPLLTGVPAVLPYGKNIGIPIKSGDDVLLLCLENELESWLEDADPEGEMRFDLADAVFIPGLQKTDKGLMKKANTDKAVIIKNGSTVLEVKSTGVEVTGNLKVSGTLTAGGINMNTHKHTVGGQDTSGPI